MGMAHEKIPRMLGVVLSSTKYGVRQSRGKFGLGAKMVRTECLLFQHYGCFIISSFSIFLGVCFSAKALVWSKKSTGLPIEVRFLSHLARGCMTRSSNC